VSERQLEWVQKERDALRARVAELEAALRGLVEMTPLRVVKDADVETWMRANNEAWEQARAALSGAAQPRGSSVWRCHSGHDHQTLEAAKNCDSNRAQPRGEPTWVSKDGKDWPGAYVEPPDAQPRGEGARCEECEGTGVVETIDYVEGTPCQSGEPCPECHGTGRIGWVESTSGGRACPACQPAPPASGAPKLRQCGGCGEMVAGECRCHEPASGAPCRECGGTGIAPFTGRDIDYYAPASSRKCPACAGSGRGP
jgi:hypothetical protein